MTSPSRDPDSLPEAIIALDVETLDTQPTAVIVQLAAVAFRVEDFEPGSYLGQFNEAISIDDCLRHGLTIDQETLKFWLFQPETARRAVFDVPTTDLYMALFRFVRFLENFRVKSIYSTSIFDPPIIRHASKKVGVAFPYRKEFDDQATFLKTVWGSKADIKYGPDPEIEHDALSDAISQAETLKLALREQARIRYLLKD